MKVLFLVEPGEGMRAGNSAVRNEETVF
jgi:hypothetical protein